MYFGWCIVAMAMLVYMLSIGTTFGAMGLFVIPVSEEFRLSRANINSAVIVLNIGNAALSPFIGRALDRYSSRGIMAVSAILFGISFVGLGLSRSIWLNVAILALPLAAALLGAGTLTMSVLLARWFTVQRGRAMMLAAMGMSLGGVVLAPVIGWLIEAEGWRTALLVMGGSNAVLLLGLAALIRDRPGPDDVEGGQAASGVQAAAPSGVDLAIASILKMPRFWSIGLSSAVALGIAQALAITVVPLAIDHGLTMMQATSLMSITGVSAITGKLLLSTVADKVERITLLSGFFLLGAVLNAGLMVSHDYMMLACCAVILGVAAGAMAPMFYALLADQFGTASFGTVRGLMAPILAVIGALIVRLAGEVYDRTGGYELLFLIFIFAQVFAACVMYGTRLVRWKMASAEAG